MALPGTGDLLVILFVLFLIFGAGKVSPLADRLGRWIERRQAEAPGREGKRDSRATTLR
jgi:Sec-independent protein translocase protein TatA